MVLCSRIRKLTYWGGRRFRIGVASLDKFLNVLGFVIGDIE